MISSNSLLSSTRRHFFHDCALGIGSLALASLFDDGNARAEATPLVNPLAPKTTHHTARAKHVIFLFMAGGPSQLELFDYKPKLTALHGKPIPDEFVKGKRFAFMDRKKWCPFIFRSIYEDGHGDAAPAPVPISMPFAPPGRQLTPFRKRRQEKKRTDIFFPISVAIVAVCAD